MKQEDIINIMHTVNITVTDNNKVKITTNPARDNLPIEVVEQIVEATVKQCAHKSTDDFMKNVPPEFVEEIAKRYDEHVFKLMTSWKIVSFILAAIIVGLIVFWR